MWQEIVEEDDIIRGYEVQRIAAQIPSDSSENVSHRFFFRQKLASCSLHILGAEKNR